MDFHRTINTGTKMKVTRSETHIHWTTNDTTKISLSAVFVSLMRLRAPVHNILATSLPLQRLWATNACGGDHACVPDSSLPISHIVLRFTCSYVSLVFRLRLSASDVMSGLVVCHWLSGMRCQFDQSSYYMNKNKCSSS